MIVYEKFHNKLHQSDFHMNIDSDGNPVDITCPHGLSINVKPSLHKKAYVALFADETCLTCPLMDKCPSHPRKRNTSFHLRFTIDNAYAVKRRLQSEKYKQEDDNLHSAVEATMRRIKHPYRAGKLSVRGKFRISCLIIGSAAMTNIRRIQRFTVSKLNDKQKNSGNKQNKPQEMLGDSFFCFIQNVFNPQFTLFQAFNL